jgi:hypothetical protein
MNTLVATLRYFASHAAAIGGAAGAVALFLTGHPTEAFAALVGALAGFGLPIKPQAQVALHSAAKP